MQIISYLGGVLIIVTIIADIVMWSYELFFKIKCRHTQGCLNEKCVNRRHCVKKKYTENEIKRIRELIDSLGETDRIVKQEQREGQL